LTQFQRTVASDKGDVLKLIRSFNEACGEAEIDDKRLSETFDLWWPRLNTDLNAIAETAETPQVPRREVPEMVEEMLEIARSLQRRQEFESTLAETLHRPPGPPYTYAGTGRVVLTRNPATSVAAGGSYDAYMGALERRLEQERHESEMLGEDRG
jgi:hypothetical protein